MTTDKEGVSRRGSLNRPQGELGMSGGMSVNNCNNKIT